MTGESVALTEHASIIHGADLSASRADSAQVGRSATPALAFAALMLSGVILPATFGLVAFHGDWGRIVKAPVPDHLALNAAANAVVLLSAIRSRGRLDRRLAHVITRTLVAHGAVAFTILVLRQWYSIPIVLMAVLGSIVLGFVFVLIGQRKAVPRIGTIGSPHPIMVDPNFAFTPILDPADSIRRFDLIVITSDEALPAAWSATVARALLAGKRIRHVSEFVEEARGVVSLDHFDVDHLPDGGLTSYRARKRLLDLVAITILLPLTAPILAVASMAVFGAMGRPIFFIQSRVGLGGREFQMVKLRTMTAGAADGAVAATVRNDPRVTPLGRWLRRFRIDEIPQFWNVLIGDMSLVGPRPEWTALAGVLEAQEPTFAFRHVVRPGITGWAQVKAGPAADLAETRVKLGYDLFYIKHLSFSLDLQILFRTVWVLATGGGVR